MRKLLFTAIMLTSFVANANVSENCNEAHYGKQDNFKDFLAKHKTQYTVERLISTQINQTDNKPVKFEDMSDKIIGYHFTRFCAYESRSTKEKEISGFVDVLLNYTDSVDDESRQFPVIMLARSSFTLMPERESVKLGSFEFTEVSGVVKDMFERLRNQSQPTE
ncbi:MAG: hypothetical protein VX786_03045 [Pseudomonadota bacterium]|nr:hypothetical protein [Pseudomonadota bacterium]MEC9333995.1 hypothetical protein [Pseudomonadota bacterium]